MSMIDLKREVHDLRKELSEEGGGRVTLVVPTDEHIQQLIESHKAKVYEENKQLKEEAGQDKKRIAELEHENEQLRKGTPDIPRPKIVRSIEVQQRQEAERVAKKAVGPETQQQRVLRIQQQIYKDGF